MSISAIRKDFFVRVIQLNNTRFKMKPAVPGIDLEELCSTLNRKWHEASRRESMVTWRVYTRYLRHIGKRFFALSRLYNGW